ncbi:trypsin-like serine peptidase [Streptomyces sp. NPDC001262]|uniref:trypsin-like serine peptidase n=1 Tax=Streptomyces sp. NPDC001262 TaxID=3364552 RepID=UPI0036938A32
MHHSPPPTVPAPDASHPGPGLREAEAYWTADRMAGARPLDAGKGGSPQQAGAAAGPGARDSARAGSGDYFEGLPMAGTFFFRDTPINGKNTYCTGSVVHSRGRSLVLTAGHCGISLQRATEQIFVPQYRYKASAADQPHGVFPLERIFMDSRYAGVATDVRKKSIVSDLDLAFVKVGPNRKGKAEDVTGALTFTRTPGYNNDVTVIGYPSSDKVNSRHQARRCPVSTTRLPGYHQMRMVCGGFYGGVSGGPWITDYDAKHRTGKVIGSTGGYNDGGNDANVDYVTYAPRYGNDAMALYEDADADREPQRHHPYDPPDDSPVLPGHASTWKHARLMASGDFTGNGHSDLIVVWTDGEVTLYPGNARGGFRPERRLMEPYGKFENALTITAGDFAGSTQFDLLVRWLDGSVTLFPDVGSKGLDVPGEPMAEKGSVWKHAVQFTAGRFNAAKYVTDLIVRWSDGEVSLYTNVGARTFGTEHRLLKKNAAWKSANVLASGEFSGNRQWDLMVRWENGALDTYVGTTTAALGREVHIHGADSTWTHGLVMTAGDYTPNGRTDDVIVRWSDGEVTMYTDTRADRIGTEEPLVTPTT